MVDPAVFYKESNPALDVSGPFVPSKNSRNCSVQYCCESGWNQSGK
jgi:hypothetical protein